MIFLLGFSIQETPPFKNILPTKLEIAQLKEDKVG